MSLRTNDMSTEPEFIVQERGAKTPYQAREWLELQSASMRHAGASFVRASYRDLSEDEDGERLWLLEGWRVGPEDQGAPRFILPKETDNEHRS